MTGKGMGKLWSRSKSAGEAYGDLGYLSGGQDQAEEYEDFHRGSSKGTGDLDRAPIEPEGGKFTRVTVLKWLFFALLVLYSLISFYHVPILRGMGGYLVVEHPLEKADLLVCLMGEPVERGLAAAELYKRNVAPRIFIPRETLPDGYQILRQRGVEYPETRDQLLKVLTGAGVPESACITDERFVEDTLEEARLVREFVEEKGYESVLVVTSPLHTRRSWITFQEVFKDGETRLGIIPSRYSNFKVEEWWKEREYVKEVLIEYQKLIYYRLWYL